MDVTITFHTGPRLFGYPLSSLSVPSSTTLHTCNARMNVGSAITYNSLEHFQPENGTEALSLFRLTCSPRDIMSGNYGLFSNSTHGRAVGFPMTHVATIACGEAHGLSVVDAAGQLTELVQESGWQQDRVFIVSHRLLMFWMDRVRFVNRPAATYLHPSYGNVRLGFAVFSTLTYWNAMTMKAIDHYGDTDEYCFWLVNLEVCYGLESLRPNQQPSSEPRGYELGA